MTYVKVYITLAYSVKHAVEVEMCRCGDVDVEMWMCEDVEMWRCRDV